MKTEFFKENTVFLASSIALIGLVVGVYYLKNISNRGQQENAKPILFTSTAARTITTGETAPEKIITKTPTKPIPVFPTNTIRQNFHNDDSNENNDD
jgi:hypothetical protein